MADELALSPAEPRPRQPLNAGKPFELEPKHRLVLQYLAHGVPHEGVARSIGVEIGVPLSIEQVAKFFGLKLRYVRRLLASPEGMREQARLLAEIRNGAKFEAARKVNELMRDPGDGSAASKKINLEAAKSVLEIGGSNAPSVNVTVNNHVETAGYIIDLREPSPEQIAERRSYATGKPAPQVQIIDHVERPNQPIDSVIIDRPIP